MAQTVEMNAADSINREDEEVEKKTKSRRPPSMRKIGLINHMD